MKNRYKTIVVAALLLAAAPLPALADWTKPYEVSYPMGDGDNRSSARQAALDQIRMKASSEAGTYVQSTTTLQENGDLTENIQTISASMVSVVELDEKLTVNASGQAVLWLRANATLDESELKRRVTELQHDKDKARQVAALQSENEALRKDLAQIRQSLQNKSDPAKTAELLSRQDATIRHLEENGRTVTQVFQRGTLLQMASRNSSDLDKAKRDLEDNFVTPLLSMPVTAEIESVEGSGNDYVALVRVGWKVDTLKLRPALKRYLTVSGYNGSIDIFGYDNLDGKGPTKLSDQVYQYLATRGIDLQLRIAGKEVRLPVFYGDNSFFGDCGPFNTGRPASNKPKYICLVSQDASSADLRGSEGHTSNPVRIHLTKEEAERATRVDASLVAFDVDQKDKARAGNSFF